MDVEAARGHFAGKVAEFGLPLTVSGEVEGLEQGDGIPGVSDRVGRAKSQRPAATGTLEKKQGEREQGLAGTGGAIQPRGTGDRKTAWRGSPPG